jgi:hypothetical protein
MKYLILLLLCFPLYGQNKLDVVYINHESGSDSNKEASAEKPLKSFRKAMSLIKESGTVYVQKTKKPYTSSFHITVGGSVEKPLKVIGPGAVIDLSTDVSNGPWIADGDSFILDKAIKRKYSDSQRAALFVNGIPVHPYAKHLKEKHNVQVMDDGRLKVRFPEGINPLDKKHKIMLNAPPNISGISFGPKASNVVVEGLAVKFAGNDGFNLHGKAKNITLKNIISVFSGDEGISAHGDIEVKVFNSIIAHNGSSSGGIADVDRSVSEYTNCVVADNYSNAFFFIGQSHAVKDCVIWGNRSKLTYRKPTKVDEKNILSFKNGDDALKQIDSLSKELQNVLKAYISFQFKKSN